MSHTAFSSHLPPPTISVGPILVPATSSILSAAISAVISDGFTSCLRASALAWDALEPLFGLLPIDLVGCRASAGLLLPGEPSAAWCSLDLSDARDEEPGREERMGCERRPSFAEDLRSTGGQDVRGCWDDRLNPRRH